MASTKRFAVDVSAEVVRIEASVKEALVGRMILGQRHTVEHLTK